jgi:hypothetical protein
MQFDRQQLVSIGTDHLCQQLLSWQQKHLLQTSFSTAEFPALAKAARHHGVPSQRGIAAWSLRGFEHNTDPQAQQCLDGWLATPSIGSLERTLLLEIWLCTSHFGRSSTGQPGLHAALGQCLSASDVRTRSQQALQEAARAWQMTCDCVVHPLEQALSALRAALPGGTETTLLQHAVALLDGMPLLVQSLRDGLANLHQACADNRAGHAAQSLDACWQTLDSQTRHTLPGLILALQSSLENAQERLTLSAAVALEQAQVLLARIDFFVACLPSACAGAIACVRIACLLLERGCLPALEALRLTLLQQNLSAPDADIDGVSRAWYAALLSLPDDFPARAGLAVEPLNKRVDPLQSSTSLGSALAQATLFNTVQALESMLKPSAEALIEQIAARPGPGHPPSPILNQSGNALTNAMLQLDEHIATLNRLIVKLDQSDEPEPTLANTLDDVQQSLQSLIQLLPMLEAAPAESSNAEEAFHRCASLLSRNLHESAALLATWSTP